MNKIPFPDCLATTVGDSNARVTFKNYEPKKETLEEWRDLSNPLEEGRKIEQVYEKRLRKAIEKQQKAEANPQRIKESGKNLDLK